MQLPRFELERYFAPREFAAKHNLSASDCEAWTIADLLKLDGATPGGLVDLSLGYTHTAGAPRLRASIARLYGPSVTDDCVIVHSGGEEGVFTFMCGVLGRGDHVVVHYPTYQSLHEIPKALGCDVSLWSANEADGWRLDLEVLRDLLNTRTRAIVVNFPHNPTGSLMARSEWDELVELARSHGLILFADEAYRGLEYDDADRLPTACDSYECGVSLGLLSKGYGLPGLRIGWIATRDPTIRANVQGVRDYTTICASAPSEFLADIALRHSGRLLSVARERILNNLRLLDEFFAKHVDRFDWMKPAAGPVGFPRLAGVEPVDAFCQRALDEAGILLLPGTVFFSPTRRFRIGFGREGVKTQRALERLDAFLR